MIIDSHCHLLSMEYENVDEQIKMAIENGVTKMIINGYDLKSSVEAVSLANKYKEVYAAVGIGPENVEGAGVFELKKIKELALNEKVVAIGEIGLDYYWTKENKQEQIEIFKKQLMIAESLHLHYLSYFFHIVPLLLYVCIEIVAVKDLLCVIGCYICKEIISCFFLCIICLFIFYTADRVNHVTCQIIAYCLKDLDLILVSVCI